MNSRETFYQRLRDELKSVDEQGLFKRERIIASPQDAVITLADGSEVLNFCANNYLGLSSHPDVLAAAHRTLDERGFGMSSVRFICGTQDIHRQLELRLAEFLHTEDTILYAAAFDANGGVFEPLLGEEDAIISDSLNHASIIDGVRLCKAQRYRYANNDMADLEAQLKAADAAGARTKLIVTDGVFSMDGYVAQMDRICDLADQYDALVMVDSATPPDSSAPPDAVRSSCAASSVASTSLPEPSAKPSAEPWVDSPPSARSSSKCSASARAPTSLATASPHPSSEPASPYSTCSTAPPSCATA